jgi:transcriptional regulator with XRE-family HTH domain
MSDIFLQRLKLARENRKLSQGELAQRSGLQPSAISHFETGSRSPSFDNLKKLADALEVSTDYLIGRSEQLTTSGPTAQTLFRHAENISSNDLELLESMAANMARKNLERGKK